MSPPPELTMKLQCETSIQLFDGTTGGTFAYRSICQHSEIRVVLRPMIGMP